MSGTLVGVEVELVREAMSVAGLSAQDLSEALGVAPSTVSRWLRGTRPTDAHLAALAALAGQNAVLEDKHALRRARVAAGLTARALAARLPVDPSAVAQWEAGRRRPDLTTAHRIADALDLPREEVADWFAVRQVVTQPVPGLAVLRAARGLRQVDLAALLGLSPATVQRMEAGRRRLTSDELRDLATRLDLDPCERRTLVGHVPAPRPAPTSAAERLRHRAGVSASAAARAGRISFARLRACEAGTARLPLAAARRLALRYGVPLAEVAHVFDLEAPRELHPRSWPQSDLTAVLRALRAWSGLSWEQLSRRTGRSVTTLYRWHQGHRSPCSEGLRTLEIAYGVPQGMLAQVGAAA